MNGLNWRTETGRSARLYWRETRVCEMCLDTIEGKGAATRYCSAKCKQAGYRENVKREKSNAQLRRVTAMEKGK